MVKAWAHRTQITSELDQGRMAQPAVYAGVRTISDDGPCKYQVSI